MKNIKCVIYDLDGVITETNEPHFLAWKELADSLDIQIDREFNETLKGVSRMDSLDKILAHGNKENIFSPEQKEVLATKKNDNYVKMISQFTKEDLFPGVYKQLQFLKDNDIKIALGSASRNGPNLLKWMEVYDFFDFIVDPTTVKGKPNPDIFLKASEVLNIPIENCIGIEDAVSGVAAIKSANIYAVGIGDKNILNQADIVYDETQHVDFEKIDLLIGK